LLLAGAAGPLVRGLLVVPESYQDEAVTCLRTVALGLPLMVVAEGLIAVLSGFQKFPLINGLGIPFSALNIFGQALIAARWPNLAAVVTVLVITRILNGLVMFWFCWQLVPCQNGVASWKREQVRRLLNFGGWITVTNIVGPLLIYLDRFVIGATIS